MSSPRDPSPSRPSLLIPTNPAFIGHADLVPRGGILLNRAGSAPDEAGGVRRLSDPDSPATSLSTLGPSSPVDDKAGLHAGAALDRRNPGLTIVAPPIDPATAFVPGAAGAAGTSPLASPSGRPKIRFAPLPDPRRPRSLSTGRNLGFRASLGAGGERQVAWELRGVEGAGEGEAGPGYGSEEAVDDASSDEVDDDDGEAGGEGAEGAKRGKRWVMGVPVPGWKGTRKLLGGGRSSRDDKDGSDYNHGGPLKKSVSTGGLMGSSPFRSNHELERKSLFQGGLTPPSAPARRPSASSSISSATHRRNSSLDAAAATPVKMLNGRVYGSRRASEAAEAAEEERRRRAREEPAFVEWGHGSKGGMGSAGAGSAARGGGDDDDDGGGMAWVRKRREERERRESERRESEARESARQAAAGAGASAGTDAAPLAAPTPAAPSFGARVAAAHEDALEREPSPKSAAAAATAAAAPAAAPSPASSPESTRGPLTPAPVATALPVIHVSEASPAVAHAPALVAPPALGRAPARPLGPKEQANAHVVTAVKVPTSPARATGGAGKRLDDDDDDEEEGEEEELDDDDDDDDGDDDDELELEGIRSTASAAGVEVVSRHK